MKKVIVIVGPTAIGKTAISIQLAKMFNCEIISGDSVAVYKGLDIGSAKPSIEERDGIKHHLIDVLEANEKYDVASFQRQAREIIDNKTLTIISGGTGLYIGSVLFDYNFAAEKRDVEFEKKYAHFSNEQLYEELIKHDPNFDREKIHVNNRKRVLRALEIVLSTNQSIESFNNKGTAVYEPFIIYLNINDRKKLYDRINNRVDLMIKNGLEQEVRELYNKGIFPNAIGYKEFLPYFEGHVNLESVIDEIKKNSRHLAKRQMTWFKNQLNTNFYEVNISDIGQTVEAIAKDIRLFLGSDS